MADSVIDPNNLTRVILALEQWANTGELLCTCLEKTGSTPNFQRARTLQRLVQQIQQTISELRG